MTVWDARAVGVALACAGCNQVYCSGAPSNAYEALASRPGADVAFRVLAERAVADHDDALALFTHREQYDRAGPAPGAADVDFAHEEIVRITARTGPGAHVAWIARSDAVLAITIDATHCPAGVPAATHTFDVVIPLAAQVPQLYVDRGKACREEAH